MKIMYDAYINCIEQDINKNPEDWTFKENPNYTQILEHVTPWQAHQYLNLIKEEFKEDTIEETIISQENEGRYFIIVRLA